MPNFPITARPPVRQSISHATLAAATLFQATQPYLTRRKLGAGGKGVDGGGRHPGNEQLRQPSPAQPSLLPTCQPTCAARALTISSSPRVRPRTRADQTFSSHQQPSIRTTCASSSRWTASIETPSTHPLARTAHSLVRSLARTPAQADRHLASRTLPRQASTSICRRLA